MGAAMIKNNPFEFTDIIIGETL
ncbi:hypothetical protein DSUL_20438 [Desulfovibrionales bacterium]